MDINVRRVSTVTTGIPQTSTAKLNAGLAAASFDQVLTTAKYKRTQLFKARCKSCC